MEPRTSMSLGAAGKLATPLQTRLRDQHDPGQELQTKQSKTRPWLPGHLPGAACVHLHLNSVAITKDTPESSPPYFKLLKMTSIGYRKDSQVSFSLHCTFAK